MTSLNKDDSQVDNPVMNCDVDHVKSKVIRHYYQFSRCVVPILSQVRNRLIFSRFLLNFHQSASLMFFLSIKSSLISRLDFPSITVLISEDPSVNLGPVIAEDEVQSPN